ASASIINGKIPDDPDAREILAEFQALRDQPIATLDVYYLVTNNQQFSGWGIFPIVNTDRFIAIKLNGQDTHDGHVSMTFNQPERMAVLEDGTHKVETRIRQFSYEVLFEGARTRMTGNLYHPDSQSILLGKTELVLGVQGDSDGRV